MVLGNILLATLKASNPSWVYIVFLLPAGLGQGMVNPSLLFSFIRMGKASGECKSCQPFPRRSTLLTSLQNTQSLHLSCI